MRAPNVSIQDCDGDYDFATPSVGGAVEYVTSGHRGGTEGESAEAEGGYACEMCQEKLVVCRGRNDLRKKAGIHTYICMYMR